MVHPSTTGRCGMNDGFLVDVPGLGQLIGALSEVTDRMRTANGRLGAASAADLGCYDLDHAAGDFQRRWAYGIGKISDASEKMTGLAAGDQITLRADRPDDSEALPRSCHHWRHHGWIGAHRTG
jgi:hypothetical protein